MQTDRTILSVGQLNRRVKQLLEIHLPLLWVSGEISNLVQHTSGHWYFTLKDHSAQVKCVMFKTFNRHLRWQPCAGQQVLLRARVSLYENRGDFQLIVEHMEQAGHGLLQQAYENLKLKLKQEGLFEPSLKKSLPTFPAHIGVITSPDGAAIHDIISVLRHRYWIAPVTIIPVAVQGAAAAETIIQSLQIAQTAKLFDIIVIARGGGSLEDLWVFNDEQLARAIAACPTPIVSAIGHEVDFTIADFVADVRAPTPSASAALITPDLNDWRQQVDHCAGRLALALQRRLAEHQKKLHHLYRRLRHPGERVQLQQQRLQLARRQLQRAIAQKITLQRQRLHQQQRRLEQRHPRQLLNDLYRSVAEKQRRSEQIIVDRLKNHRQSLATWCQLLDAVSPLRTLQRGYAIVTDDHRRVVHSAKTLVNGDAITVKLYSGSIIGEVKKLVHDQEAL